jgi:hypothetical protein
MTEFTSAITSAHQVTFEDEIRARKLRPDMETLPPNLTGVEKEGIKVLQRQPATVRVAMEIALTVGREVADHLKAHFDHRLGKLHAELAVIKARLSELERRPAMKYLGVWSDRTPYDRGDLITFDGSMWASKKGSTGVRPGSDPEAWQLCVKRGRDAR